MGSYSLNHWTGEHVGEISAGWHRYRDMKEGIISCIRSEEQYYKVKNTRFRKSIHYQLLIKVPSKSPLHYLPYTVFSDVLNYTPWPQHPLLFSLKFAASQYPWNAIPGCKTVKQSPASTTIAPSQTTNKWISSQRCSIEKQNKEGAPGFSHWNQPHHSKDGRGSLEIVRKFCK